MTSSRRREHRSEGPALTEPRPSFDTSRKWYQHPFVVFLVPLLTLLCFPNIYNLVVPASSALQPYEEEQLQGIATLMDDIYTSLANMSFIAHTSIKRGPHQINTTAITCARDPAVLRLMEILPYVDIDQVEEPDWLFGGTFMDYRRHDHLLEGCDPLRAQTFWDYMNPQTVALTNWGTGGWNGDRTWVLLYDTKRHAIRIYEGESFIYEITGPQAGVEDFTGVGIFRDGIEAAKSTQGQWGSDWAGWFGTAILLQRLKAAYQTAAWSPWQTSNREKGWGVKRRDITHLLRLHGWPGQFDADQFNVAFIRAKFKSSGSGFAVRASRIIKELQGETMADGRLEIGHIGYKKREIVRLENELKREKDLNQRWIITWRLQKANWDLERADDDLQDAIREKQRLCPGGVCVRSDELILWDFRAIEKEYTKAQGSRNSTTRCRSRIENVSEHAPPDPNRFDNCIAQLKREKFWLHLAYSQSKAEALQHCAKAGCTLLPPDNLEVRAKAKIEEYVRIIAQDLKSWERITAWIDSVPDTQLEARHEAGIYSELTRQGRSYRMHDIEQIEEQLAEGGDKDALWANLEGWMEYDKD